MHGFKPAAITVAEKKVFKFSHGGTFLMTTDVQVNS